VALVITDVSEKLSASFITLLKEALSFSETSVLARATRRNIPKYSILHFVKWIEWSLKQHAIATRNLGTMIVPACRPVAGKIVADASGDPLTSGWQFWY
jgi:hypothetical protein